MREIIDLVPIMITAEEDILVGQEVVIEGDALECPFATIRSQDCQKAVLLINDFPNAVFDFSRRRGFCRTRFPPPNSIGVWSIEWHRWNDSVVELFN